MIRRSSRDRSISSRRSCSASRPGSWPSSCASAADIRARSATAATRGRKPSPRFLFDARDEFGIDLSQSYMVGDKLIDLECGWNAGVKKSILVRTGYGAEWERSGIEKVARANVVNGLAEAAEWILAAKNPRP